MTPSASGRRAEQSHWFARDCERAGARGAAQALHLARGGRSPPHGRAPVLLLTGFEKYLPREPNPTAAAVPAFDGRRFGRWRVVARVLPVSYVRARGELDRLLREHRPRAVVAFGMAGEGPIRLEEIAVNVQAADRPDNDGRKRRGEPVSRRGALALRSRLPLGAIEGALRRARLPVRRSHHAGTYVCNALFYHLLGNGPRAAGFVHVPPLARRGRRRGRLSLAGHVRVVEAVLRAVAEQ